MTWLMVLIGPVGSGKTRFAMEIRDRVPCVVISNDDVRRELFSQPKYTPIEVEIVHMLAMNRIRQVLLSGQHVVYDGTNLTRSKRRELRAVIGNLAQMMSVVVCAPETVIRVRLQARDEDRPRRDGKRWWDVYQELQSQMETPEEPYLIIDSSQLSSSGVDLLATLLK